MKMISILSGIGAAALLATGCVEKRVVYVPAQPAYTAPVTPPPASATAPATPSAQANAPEQSAASPPAQTPSGTTVEAPVPPPAPMAEVVPVAPGPEYAWTPGFWSWNGVTWVWVRGAWVVRPRVGAVW